MTVIILMLKLKWYQKFVRRIKTNVNTVWMEPDSLEADMSSFIYQHYGDNTDSIKEQ